VGPNKPDRQIDVTLFKQKPSSLRSGLESRTSILPLALWSLLSNNTLNIETPLMKNTKNAYNSALQ
jgi:hypothetical protein